MIKTILLWALFFATSAYGHVALKVAVNGKNMFSPLALSAYAGWSVSAILWAIVLSRHSLLSANGISAARYAIVAISAVVFLREPMSIKHVIGTLLAFGGVVLLAR